MARGARRPRKLRLAAVAVLAAASAGWGTLISPISLGVDTEKQLRGLIDEHAIDPRIARQLDYRAGPHPIHQFIAYQAYLLLQRDPAFADGASGFPTGEEINAWDGIERERGYMWSYVDRDGMLPRALAPYLPGVGGPSADAERIRPAGFNTEYNGQAHYWNPWMNDGEAPGQAGANHSRLIQAIIDDETANVRAHYAAYMAHYVSDVTSARHADAIHLDDAAVRQLAAWADQWEAEGSPYHLIGSGLESAVIEDAEELIRDQAYDRNPREVDRWWARIERHIANVGSDPLFQRGTLDTRVDIPESSVRTAVACYLHGLAARVPGQDLGQFFSYFDPLYFNGPIIDPIVGDTIWEPCVGLGTHLYWETNPAHYRGVIDYMHPTPKPMLTGPVRDYLRPFHLGRDAFSADLARARDARAEALARLTRDCSEASHGAIDGDGDFEAGHRRQLELAIGCTFTAFRASITGLRVDATGRRGDGDRVVLSLDVRNLADRPARLHHLRIAHRAGGAAQARPGWVVALDGRTVGAGDALPVRVEVEGVPADVPIAELTVDLHGEVADTPDAGWRRARVRETGADVTRDPGAITRAGAAGPVDLIVVMDTTSSMSGELDALRRKAIEAIRELERRSGDIRLAGVEFRDLGVRGDKGHFRVSGFDRRLDATFGFLESLAPGGGGDLAEDQLHGIDLALRQWEDEGPTDRKPTKLIVVITDAPAKSPDTLGNTFESIARRAFEVDPARIYPIVARNNRTALAHAEQLARATGGKVLRAASPDQAVDAMLEAVDLAAAEEAAPPRPPARRPARALWLAGGGLGLLGAAALVLAVVLRRRAARSRA